MHKFIKWGIVVLLGLGLVLLVLYRYNLNQTKKHSPEEIVEYVQGDLEIEIFYNRPYKKGREIFGGLVPFGEVWRTGANEATTFETNQPLDIEGQELPSGKYTLWTIPGETRWQVIFNSKMYPWGVNNRGEARRDPQYDVLTVSIPVGHLPSVIEQFTISVKDADGLRLLLEWDQTQIAVPLE